MLVSRFFSSRSQSLTPVSSVSFHQGTTDAAANVEQNPIPQEKEIQWILDEVRNYLSDDIKIRRGDVLSAWSGIRPLVKDPDAKDTQSLVRNRACYPLSALEVHLLTRRVRATPDMIVGLFLIASLKNSLFRSH